MNVTWNFGKPPKDKPALARYNLKDCELVTRIFAKTELLKFLLERASVTGEPDLPLYDRAPGIFVPQHGGGDPAPPESLFPGDVSRGEGIHCLPQRRNRGSGTIGDQPRQAIQEHIDWAGRVPGRGKGPRGPGDLEHIAGIGPNPLPIPARRAAPVGVVSSRSISTPRTAA